MAQAKELYQQSLKRLDDAKAYRETIERGGRQLTEDEMKTYTAGVAEAMDFKAQGDQAKTAAEQDQRVSELAKNLADLTGAANDEASQQLADVLKGQPSNAKTNHRDLGQLVVASKSYLDFLDQHKSSGGNIRIPDGLPINLSPIKVDHLIGRKAVITGASDTSGGAFVVAEQSGIVEMLGRKPLTMRDIISVRRTSSDAVEYVQQTSHTNAAAPVAEATSSLPPTAPGTAGPLVPVAGGGYKPEGSWAFLRVSTTVKTIAEVATATKRAFADAAQMEGLIRDELIADLAETEEAEILTGDGTGEHFDGINHVSGTQSQAWSTDFFTTTRKAVTLARVVGRANPNAWVMNPADVEVMDLIRTNTGGAGTGTYFGAGPFALGPRTLWGYPVVECESQTAGTGVLGDFKKAVLWDREEASVTMTNSHADYFIRNLVALLGEERAAFGVTRPSAFVKTAMHA